MSSGSCEPGASKHNADLQTEPIMPNAKSQPAKAPADPAIDHLGAQGVVDFYDLAIWLRSYDRVVEAQALPCRVVTKSIRLDLKPDADFAWGVVEVDLVFKGTKVTVRGAWEARGQAMLADGWYVMDRPSAKEIGIETFLRIEDEGIHLNETDDALSGLAFDFWSYVDTSEIITTILPDRTTSSRTAR